MKIYFASAFKKNRFEICKKCGVVNFLISFNEIREGNIVTKYLEDAIENKFSVIVDSGAHTLQKGIQKPNYNIFFQRYIDFLDKYIDKIDAYVELDIENVVGLKQVEEWTQTLKKRYKKPPIVVWHRERGWDYWIKMCKEYPYIGFSGFVTTPSGGPEVPNKFIPLFFKYAKKYSTKVHGFGFTRLNNIRLMSDFYSVDSTSWLVGSKFGRSFSNKKFKKDAHFYERDRYMINYILQKEKEINKLFKGEVNANKKSGGEYEQ